MSTSRVQQQYAYRLTVPMHALGGHRIICASDSTPHLSALTL